MNNEQNENKVPEKVKTFSSQMSWLIFLGPFIVLIAVKIYLEYFK